MPSEPLGTVAPPPRVRTDRWVTRGGAQVEGRVYLDHRDRVIEAWKLTQEGVYEVEDAFGDMNRLVAKDYWRKTI